MAINARLLDPSVIAGIRVHLFDGADTWKTLGYSVHPRVPTETT